MFAVAHVLGLLLASFAASYAAPLLCSLWLHDGLWEHFLLSGAITAGSGLLLAGATRRFRRELKPRDGFLLVTLGWLLLPAAATLPLLVGIPGLSFTRRVLRDHVRAHHHRLHRAQRPGRAAAVAELLAPPADLDRRPRHHRHGARGAAAARRGRHAALQGAGARPVKEEQLAPRITETARNLWVVYVALTAAGVIALKLCGMSWFDALCHAFSAVGLGGFSTHDRSIAYFDSAAIEFVLMVLMVIAALNFARHFVALRQLSLETYKKDPECRAIFGILTLSVLGIAALLSWHGVYPDFLHALRHAAFNVISQATTSGLTTQDYQSWPVFAPFWMLFLGCLVCSTGSTGGGIKMFRALLLARQTGRELKLLIHPAAMAPVRIGGRAIPDAVGHAVLAFIFLYFATVAVLIFAMLLTGLDFDSSFAAVVASINNTAHGFGAPGAVHNFHSLSTLQTWICTAAMLLGRLEIFSIAVLLRPAYWRK